MAATTATTKTIKDIMNADPIAVEASTSARELARVLADNNISGVPVLDPQDRVIGVVSKTDLLHWCITGGLGSEGDDLFAALGRTDIETTELGSVDDFMSVDPVVATRDEAIKIVAQRMVREQVHRVIVLDEDGCLEGIVTSMDLLKALSE